jgi:hypothetical protein
MMSGKIMAPWDVVLVLLYDTYTTGKHILEDQNDPRN